MLDLSSLPWTSRIAAHNVRVKHLMNNIQCLLPVLSEDAKNPRDKWFVQDRTSDGRSHLESIMGVLSLYLPALPVYPNYCCPSLNVHTYRLVYLLPPSLSLCLSLSLWHSDEYKYTGQAPNWQLKLVSPSNSCIYNTASAQTSLVVKGLRF